MNTGQIVATVLLIVGLLLLLFGIISYFVLAILQKKYKPDEVVRIITRKDDVSNPVAKINVMSIVLFGCIILGLALVLTAILVWNGAVK